MMMGGDRMEPGSSSLLSAKEEEESPQPGSSISGAGRSGTPAAVSTPSCSFNPLLMEDVLENVFEYCDKESIYNCRLVNQHWHHHSLPAWLKHVGTIKLNGEEDSDSSNAASFLFRRHSSEGLSLQRFLHEVHHSPSSQFEYSGLRRATSFEIAGLEGGTHHSLAPNSFWICCGPWITSLTLLDFTCRDLVLFRDIVCGRFTPRLETLHVDVTFALEPNSATTGAIDDDDGTYKGNRHFKSLHIEIKGRPPPRYPGLRGIGEFPFEWDKILALYPNLKAVKLRHTTHKYQNQLERIFAAILKIRKQDATKLKSLNMVGVNFKAAPSRKVEGEGLSQSVVVPLLQNPLLKLLATSVRFDEGTEEEGRILVELLASQKSLYSLQFYSPVNFPNLAPVPFPTQDCLVKLIICGFPFPNLLFLQSFPNLKSLTFRRGSGSDGQRESGIVRNTSREDMRPLPSVSKFSCNYRIGYEEDVQGLKKWFPNIKILKLHLNGSTFAAVCRDFPNLKELVVRGDGLGDVELVGSIGAGMRPRATPRSSPDAFQRARHNITALKKLKSFEMKTNRDLSDCLTEVTVVHGFAKLQKLRSLKIDCGGKLRPFTRATFEELLPFAKMLAFGEPVKD